jgi:DNA-binding MarR family transcriptional regulator
MAYRKVHESFWTDPDMEELTPEQKLFYLYLITNPACNQIGLYEFSVKRAAFETGYHQETIVKLLEQFEQMRKIKRSKTSKEILVIKFLAHNSSNSPKVQAHVQELLKKVKDTVLIQYLYSMDTQTQEEEKEEEEEEEQIKNKNADIVEATTHFVRFWNHVHGTNLKHTSDKERQVKARLKMFKPEEIQQAIYNRYKDPWFQSEGSKFLGDWESFWRNDAKVERYLNRKLDNITQPGDLPF